MKPMLGVMKRKLAFAKAILTKDDIKHVPVQPLRILFLRHGSRYEIIV